MSKKNKRAKKGNHLEEKDLGKVTGGIKQGGCYPGVGIEGPDITGAIVTKPWDNNRIKFEKK